MTALFPFLPACSSTITGLGLGAGGDDESDWTTSSGGTSGVGGQGGLVGGGGVGGGGGMGAGGLGGAGAGGSTGTGGAGAGGSTGTGTGGAGTGGSTGTGGGSTTTTSTVPPCADGTIQCDGGTKKVCDGDGGFKETVDCAPGVCMPAVGCAVCAPGKTKCAGNVASYCRDDGSGWVTETCDALQGTACNAGTGTCSGACGVAQLGKSYIGCDYFPTVTNNSLLANGSASFAVAVSNTTANAGTITVTQGATTITTVNIAANSVQVIKLPWVNALKNSSSSALVVKGAYRLRSTQPVTVYQFNPLEYDIGGAYTYSNDASLLLPATAWTGTYNVVAWPHWTSYSGLYAITAKEDGTTVTVTAPPGAPTSLVEAGISGLPATGAGTIALNAGDVAQVLSASSDVTGTRVSADKPIQVIGGHECTQVPIGVIACDHLEESMFPYETLSNAYIVTAPLINASTTKVRVVRILATEANTTLTYDPPQVGVAGSIAQAGKFIEVINTKADFAIIASAPVVVVEYFEGQDAGGGAGDPAMAIAVGKEQYRKSYLFHAPTNYASSFANVVCPTGANAIMDGAPPPPGGFTPIGATGFGIARVAISNTGNGNHTLVSDKPCGLSVYGYGDYTSYWYPGGADLRNLRE
jgi:hypothetical protein